MMTYALPAAGLLIAKLLIVLTLAYGISARRKIDLLGAWLCAWVAIQAAMLAAIFLASAAGILTGYVIWIAVALVALAVGTWTLSLGGLPTWSRRRPDPFAAFAGLAFVMVVALLSAKALIFTDNSLDAQVYGIVRNAIWMHDRSVFVHMPTPNFPVFTYEWVGELVALPYALVSGNIQGLPFGNVECVVFCFFAFAWLAVRLGAPASWAFFIGLALVTSPALLGLSSAIKGDLLACGAMAFAAGHAVRFSQERDGLSAFFLPVGIAMAVGAKLTAVVFGLPLAIAGAILLLRSRDLGAAAAMAAGCVLSAVFLLRYGLNAVFFDSALMHAEEPRIGLATFLDNVEWLLRQLIQFAPEPAGRARNTTSLAGGFGLLSVVIAVAVLVEWSQGMRPARWRVFLLALAAFVTLAMMFMLPYYPWSLRYYLPAILIGVTALLAAPVHVYRMPVRIGFAGVCLFAAVLNSLWFVRPGEVWGNRSLEDGLNYALAATPLQRATMLSREVPENFDIGVDFDIKDRTQTFVVLHQINAPILSVVGSYAQNRLIFTRDADDLIAVADRMKPDFVVLTKHRLYPVTEATRRSLALLGYTIRKDGAFAAIAARNGLH